MFNEENRVKRPIRWGMVGGGRGSEIGYIHRASALKDGAFTLKAGAFDIDYERAVDFGVNIGVSSDRIYKNYKDMFEAESKLEDGIEAVTIATPNCFHYEMSKAALNYGLHVVCEKPLCFTVEEAEELVNLARDKKLLFGTTYGYAGAPMLHEAKKLVEANALGDIRIIQGQFAHGFHAEAVEDKNKNSNTKWRVTESMVGKSYVLGDLGVHVLYIIKLINPNLKIKRLMCNRQSFVASRKPLEDNAFVTMEFDNGAMSTIWVSAVNSGSMHQEKIRVIGSKASVEWWDEHPNQLSFEECGQPTKVLHRGMGYLHKEDNVVNSDRLGAGHAEGLFEAWANLYFGFSKGIEALQQGNTPTEWYPSVEDACDGVKWIEKCVYSADNDSCWVVY